MNTKFVSVAFAGLFAFVLSGSAVSADAARPNISEEARQALAQAVADADTAKARFALWTTAENALKIAQEAAMAGDSNGVISQAKFVSSQVRLGLAQVKYPSTEQ